MPLLSLCRRTISSLSNSHFLLLIDDAQALNEGQIKTLNSWIAFRDHSLFSFKVATTKVARTTRTTISGGSILEGHDYSTIDLERPLHNRNTGFYRLASLIIKRRLADVGIDVTPADFFPENPKMVEDLSIAKEKTKTAAFEKFGPSASSKRIGDYVYKNYRARYFKDRPSQANRPPYSGFETLVYISTGVIRNLLEPCYWMFDRVISEKRDNDTAQIEFIPPTVQTEIILERSDDAWARLRERLSNDIEGCTVADGQRAFKLVSALAAHFRERLLG